MFSGTDVVKQCLCLLKNNGVRRARLGGGEPTRHLGFMEIVRYSVARQNMDDDQYPIGAIITDDRGKIISSSRSSLRKELDPTNHPEIAAIRKASKILKRRK